MLRYIYIYIYIYVIYIYVLYIYVYMYFYISIRIFFTDTGDSQHSRGREGPSHVRWQSRILNSIVVFTRLFIDKIHDLIKLPFQWLIYDAMLACLLDELVLGFCYSYLTLETGGFELPSTITLVLQANRLTKCASYPIYINIHIYQSF